MTENITQVAANKAAEGGLPDLDNCFQLWHHNEQSKEMHPDFRGEWVRASSARHAIHAYILADRRNNHSLNSNDEQIANWLRRQANAEKEPVKREVFIEAHNAAREIIAADRASRQVANKAEVEPVAHLKFWARQSWSGNGNHDVEHAEGLEVCKAGEIGDDGEPSFPVYAIPPATTGASTVLTDERIDAMHTLILEVLSNHRMVRMFEVEDGGLGNSYPLIDRLCLDGGADVESGQVEVDALAWAIADKLSASDSVAREVAAQAGQVAVPDDVRTLIANLPLPSGSKERRHGFVDCKETLLGLLAAPSPAKESK